MCVALKEQHRRTLKGRPTKKGRRRSDLLATLQVLSGGVSPYAPIVFMTVEKENRRFFTMEDASDHEKKW